MAPRSRYLLTFLSATILLLSCGGGGVPIPGLPNTGPSSGGGSGSGGNAPNLPDAPPPPGDPDEPIFDPGSGDEEGSAVSGFSTDVDQTSADTPGQSAIGFVGYQTTPRLLTMLADSGAAGGLYRINLRMNAPDHNLGTYFAAAEAAGLRTWLNVAGTPLSLSDSADNSEVNGLPPFARRTPTDIDAWATLVVNAVQDIQTDHGFLPDYVEIWNEPDREEFFDGTLEQYLEIYAITATRLRMAFPTLKVGGMALAGASSTMGGSDSALFALIEYAQDEELPLDFVSWHHYDIANGLLATNLVDDLRSALTDADLEDSELVVSEWNIHPTPDVHGAEFDSSKAAANYAGFQATARLLGLDGNMYFMVQDNAGGANSADLTGLGMGALTAHGIKKPVFRLMEFLQPMAHEPEVQVLRPDGELAMNVYATRSGNRVRFVISNNVVDGDWIWNNRLRERGFKPGVMWPLFKAASWEHGDHHPSVALMMAHGLTEPEALAIEDIMPELEDAWSNMELSQSIEIALTAASIPTIADVYLFDSTNHNPAMHQEVLQAQIELSETAARADAWDAVATYLTNQGHPVTGEELAASPDIEVWADTNGVSNGVAIEADRLHRRSLEDARFRDHALLNALPQTDLEGMTAEEAGITLVDGILRLTLEPDAVIVFDVLL